MPESGFIGKGPPSAVGKQGLPGQVFVRLPSIVS